MDLVPPHREVGGDGQGRPWVLDLEVGIPVAFRAALHDGRLPGTGEPDLVDLLCRVVSRDDQPDPGLTGAGGDILDHSLVMGLIDGFRAGSGHARGDRGDRAQHAGEARRSCHRVHR
jgi:hypothetical protein